MSQQTPKVLIVGDYWHSDFRTLILNSACATTLVSTDQLSDEHLTDPSFDLAVLVAARRDQFSHEWVETIRGKLAPTPLVAMLGSWCEGEQRSGEPWPGIQRVYWHQWRSRFDFFLKQLAADQVCDWHLPATANHADTVSNPNLENACEITEHELVVGVSAVSEMHYQMIADALHFFETKPFWIERRQRQDSAIEQPPLIVVDGDSWSLELETRIDWLRNDLKIDSPIVQLLNFPRRSDLPALHAAGITEVVSKPFQLSDLALAIKRAKMTTGLLSDCDLSKTQH